MSIRQLKRAYDAGRYDIIYRYIRSHERYADGVLRLCEKWGKL